MRNISDKVVVKIKLHIFKFKNVSRKSCRLWDNVEKYGTAGRIADDNIVRHMGFACGIYKATDTLSEFLIFMRELIIVTL
jgi:hypothetical protein